MKSIASIRIATKQAKKSTFKQRMGAVLVSRAGFILGVGNNEINRYTGKWKQSWPGSLHAEESAILHALKKHSHDQLIGSTVYVTRIDAKGNQAFAKPCLHCQTILKAFQIKDVYYTTPTGVEILELR